VKLGTWSIYQYAALPGLARVGSFTSETPQQQLTPINVPTPMSYILHRFALWRGSVKIKMQIFASTFVSTRFAVWLVPQLDVIGSGEYDNYIVRIVEVKGDTTIEFTVPFPSPTTWWTTATCPYNIIFRPIAPIVGFDSTVDARFDYAIWMAAGEDFQVCSPYKRAWVCPTTSPLPEDSDSKALTVNPDLKTASKVLSRPLPPGIRRQSAIVSDFAKSFEPIVDKCSYTLDNGYAASDVPVTFNDLLKRYYLYYGTSEGLNPTDVIDSEVPQLQDYLRCFGAVRGGYRVKFQVQNAIGKTYDPVPIGVLGVNPSSAYGWTMPADGGYYAVSIPWNEPYPWVFRGMPLTYTASILPPPGPNSPTLTNMLVAFRDDVETGFPLLPVSDPV
jgi:hypothetical protein